MVERKNNMVEERTTWKEEWLKENLDRVSSEDASMSREKIDEKSVSRKNKVS